MSFLHNAAERVDDRVAPTSFRNMICYHFWRDTVPSFFIQQAPRRSRVQRQVARALGRLYPCDLALMKKTKPIAHISVGVPALQIRICSEEPDPSHHIFAPGALEHHYYCC